MTYFYYDLYVLFCVIYCHLFNLKHVKTPMEEEFFSKAVDLCWCLFLINIMNAAVSQKLPFILIIFITIYM